MNSSELTREIYPVLLPYQDWALLFNSCTWHMGNGRVSERDRERLDDIGQLIAVQVANQSLARIQSDS